MKMDVVLFGEALQYGVLQEAMRAATAADVILVVGTSLSVSADGSCDVDRVPLGGSTGWHDIPDTLVLLSDSARH